MSVFFSCVPKILKMRINWFFIGYLNYFDRFFNRLNKPGTRDKLRLGSVAIVNFKRAFLRTKLVCTRISNVCISLTFHIYKHCKSLLKKSPKADYDNEDYTFEVNCISKRYSKCVPWLLINHIRVHTREKSMNAGKLRKQKSWMFSKEWLK